MGNAIYAVDMQSYNAHSELNNTAKDANTLNQLVNNFRFCGGEYLKGEQWKAVQEKLSKYSDAMSKRAEVASEMFAIIDAVVARLAEFIAPYDEINPDKKEEFEEAIKTLAKEIEQLIYDRDRLYDNSYWGVINEETQEKGWIQSQRYLSDAEKEPFNKSIQNATELKIYFEKWLEKINQLDAELAWANGQLDSAESAVDVFKSMVDAITPSGMFNYEKGIFEDPLAGTETPGTETPAETPGTETATSSDDSPDLLNNPVDYIVDAIGDLVGRNGRDPVGVVQEVK